MHGENVGRYSGVKKKGDTHGGMKDGYEVGVRICGFDRERRERKGGGGFMGFVGYRMRAWN